MKSSDYTLPFYKKCLGQHLWDWRSRFVTTAVVRHHEQNEEMLKRVAHERGGEFFEAYNQVSPQSLFPFAGIPATEIPNEPTHNTTPMKLTIDIPEELFNPLVQAIDRLTEAVKRSGFAIPRYDGPLTGTNDSASTTVIDGVTEADKPKRGRKAKEATPEGVKVETRPDDEQSRKEDAESDLELAKELAEGTPTSAAAPVPTGPELAKKVEPLAAHPELQQDLIRFKANELKINGPIRLVTDADLLRRFDAKVEELLAKIPTEV